MKDIIIQLTHKELRVRYKNLSFGYLWSIANPLAYAALYYIVFKAIMKVKVENFPVFLICGLFPWQWFANSVGVAPMTFLGNAPLIKKVNFPRYLLNLVAVMQDMLHFLAALPVVVVFLFIFNKYPTLDWLVGIPILCGIQLILTYGLNLFIATLNLFFRDLERLIQIGMTFLFYTTPVVFDLQMVPELYRPYIIINPVAPLIISWRGLLLDGYINWYYCGISLVWALIILWFGQFVYKKLSWRFAEIL
jgi:lipopolysaccharide transport system permease protein